MCRLQGFKKVCDGCGKQAFVRLVSSDGPSLTPCAQQIAYNLEVAQSAKVTTRALAGNLDKLTSAELLSDALDYDLKWKTAEACRLKLHLDSHPRSVHPTQEPAVVADENWTEAAIDLMNDLQLPIDTPGPGRASPARVSLPEQSVQVQGASRLSSAQPVTPSIPVIPPNGKYDTLPPPIVHPSTYPDSHDYASIHLPAEPCFCALLDRVRYAKTGEVITNDTLWDEWFRQSGSRATSTAKLTSAFLTQAGSLSTTTQAPIGLHPKNALMSSHKLPPCPGMIEYVVNTVRVASCNGCQKSSHASKAAKRKDRSDGGDDDARDDDEKKPKFKRPRLH